MQERPIGQTTFTAEHALRIFRVHYVCHPEGNCPLYVWQTPQFFALLGVFTKQPRVEPLGENTKQGEGMTNTVYAQPMLCGIGRTDRLPQHICIRVYP